jgi:ATP-dependent metalloprotease
MPQEVVTRVESGRFACSEEVLEQYVVALVCAGELPERLAPAARASLGAVLSSGRYGDSRAALVPGEVARDAVASVAGARGAEPFSRPHHNPVDPRASLREPALGAAAAGSSRANPVFVESVRRAPWWSWVLNGVITLVVLRAAWGAYKGGGAAAGGPGGGLFAPFVGDIAAEVAETPDTTFDDVRGCDEAKAELQDIVAFLRDPARFKRLGAKIPAGVLLTGPPGTGKTLLARAVAGEAGCHFYAKSASEFEEMLVGLGARRVRELFESARKNAPAIIFIDEIDALGGKRRASIGQNSERQTLNQLLSCMDGFNRAEGVIVIGATNAPDVLDSALTRPGRFDTKVDVGLPDVLGRKQILELYLRRVVADAGIDVDLLARATPGFSGAQLAALVNSAALLATNRSSKAIETCDVEEARDKLIMGPSKVSRVRTQEMNEMVAYHEGGHTLVSLLTEGTSKLHKVTILPRGDSGGATYSLPNEDALHTRASLLAQIDVCMGGRVAEELVYGAGKVTAGAAGDFKQASDIARRYCASFSMSDGLAFFEPGAHNVQSGEWKPSEERHAALDAEVDKILQASYTRVKTLLTEKRRELDRLAAALVRGLPTPPPPSRPPRTRSPSFTHTRRPPAPQNTA